MRKELLMVLVMVVSACLFMALSYNCVLAFGDDEVKKIKMDEGLFDEYYKLMQQCFKNAKFEGVVKQKINGADVESKYIAYSKDIDYKKIEISSYGEKLSYVVTPDKVWYFYEKSNYVVYFASKKNIAKHNSRVNFDMARQDGKITKSVADGQITYKITEYENNTRQTFVFDEKTKQLKFQTVESDSGEKMETSYKLWEGQTIAKDIFNYPARAIEKCID